MGDLIVLAERLAARSREVSGPRTVSGPGAAARPRPVRRPHPRPAFYFDLACPFSYLAAERVERVVGNVQWVPTAAVALHRGVSWAHTGAARAQTERRALELRLPLVWPDRFPADTPGALRAAAHAAEIGAGARFALAASRLAFCGGFDLEDPEILAEAAAAAGIALDACLAAAGDPSRDGPLHATARDLLAQGIRRLPALIVGGRGFDGERRLVEAGAMLRGPGAYRAPLAPAS